jgi:hypothetical protein
VQRRYRQPVYDEEKIGHGAAPSSIQLFAKRRGETDAANHQKTIRDTNILANGALGALQEFMLVGFNVMLDWHVLVVDYPTAQAASAWGWSETAASGGTQDNELNFVKVVLNDGFFQFQFGRQQPIVEIPLDKIPFGVGPQGYIAQGYAESTGATLASAQYAHVITNGIPSSKEFFDIRERRNSFVHVLPDNSFSATISWPNTATLDTPLAADKWGRIMTYMIGVLLSPL